MPWSPPTELLPVTPEVYAAARVSIDAGNAAITAYAKARDNGCKPKDEGGEGCWIDTKPPTAALAEWLYRYIPTSAVPLDAAQKFAATYLPGDKYFPDTDTSRLGWPTFVDRPALIAALDGVTSPEVMKQIGSLDRPPDASAELAALPTGNAADPDTGMQWWIVALSGSGFLSWLGKSKVLAALGPGKKVKLLLGAAAGLFYYLGLAGAVSSALPEVKKVIKDVVTDPLANASKKATNIVGIAAGIGGAALVGFVVYKVVTNKKKQRSIAA